MVTLIKAHNKYYSEIFQSISILMAFVTKKDDTYTQLFSPVKCRDFLGDCIWSYKTKQPAQIYGFGFDYSQTPYDQNMLRMSLTFPDEQTLTNFATHQDFLHTIETRAFLGFEVVHFTKLLSTNDPLTLILEADPIWQSSQWKLSLYTFYLKLMGYKDVTKPANPEKEYLPLLTPEIEAKLLDKVLQMEDNIGDGISQAHNYSGFVSVIKNQNKVLNQLLLQQ